MTDTPEPWYRHRWVWFVIAPPAASIVAGLWLVGVAYHSADDLVVDDYRKIGRTFEMSIERDRIAASLGAEARVAFDDAGEVGIEVELDGPRPSALVLRVIHPTEARRDLLATLLPGPDGVYRARFSERPAGRRYLQLEPADGDWRLTGEIASDGGVVTLTPPR